MNEVYCVLCRRSEETGVTGALSTKQHMIPTKHQDTVMIDITAHQNCLLYSSGIFCKNSPEFDDLFGFAVNDVLEEVQRGRRLNCPHCKKNGATAGCEIKKCKKSFHYPCAVEHGAKVVENQVDGKYGIYCPSHSELVNGESVSGVKRPHSSKSPRVSRTSKKTTANGASAARASSPSRRLWSGLSISSKKSLCLTSSDEEEEEEENLSQVKRKRSRIMSDDSSESGDGLIAPVGSDESLNSSPEQQSPVLQPTSSEPQKSTPFETEDRVDKQGCVEDDDETISDAESESLLNHARPSCSRQSSSETNEAAENARFSVAVQTIKKECEEFSIQADYFPEEEDVNGSFLQESCTERAPIPRHSSPRSACQCSSCSDLTVNRNGVAPSEPMNVTVVTHSAPSPPLSPPAPHEEPANDSAGFWRKCNAAKCTQVIFSDFVRWITILSSRIQADEASQEDYERALSVIKASGQLENIVVAQQKDLQRRLTELQTAAAAMEEVVSALR